MVKVVMLLNFVLCHPSSRAMKVYTNRCLLLSFVLVLVLSFTATVYVISCDATRTCALTWRDRVRGGSAAAVVSELTQGRLTVLYSKQRRARQKAAARSRKAAVRGRLDESSMLSTAAEQRVSVNDARKKASVWDRQDKEWRILDDVIESILRNDDERWSHSLTGMRLPLNNRTAVQQSYMYRYNYVYPLLREYLIRYSNWIPPKPGEASATQLRTDRKNLCMDSFCLSQLEPGDEKIHFLCLQRSLDYSVRTDLLQNRKSRDDILAGMQCNCRLLKENEKLSRKRVVLSSLPGSGNTWVRQLLESATGICTGSMWCDPSLRANHFCGEGQHGRSLLVIKDHSGNVPWTSSRREEERDTAIAIAQRRPDYDAMILVHRDPFDATVAEWNRALFDKEQNSSHGRDMHVASYGLEMFGELHCTHSKGIIVIPYNVKIWRRIKFGGLAI